MTDAEYIRILTENPLLTTEEANRAALRKLVHAAQKERDDEFAAEIAALFGQAYTPETILRSLGSN
jgi:hypothetical protein